MGKYIKQVADLIKKALRNPQREYKDYPYIAVANAKGDITLWHYGTVIFDTTSGSVKYGGYSVSDRNAIETAMSVIGMRGGVTQSQQAYKLMKKGDPHYRETDSNWLVYDPYAENPNQRSD